MNLSRLEHIRKNIKFKEYGREVSIMTDDFNWLVEMLLKLNAEHKESDIENSIIKIEDYASKDKIVDALTDNNYKVWVKKENKNKSYLEFSHWEIRFWN